MQAPAGAHLAPAARPHVRGQEMRIPMALFLGWRGRPPYLGLSFPSQSMFIALPKTLSSSLFRSNSLPLRRTRVFTVECVVFGSETGRVEQSPPCVWHRCARFCWPSLPGALNFFLPLCLRPFSADLSVLFSNRRLLGLTSCQKPCT